MKNYRNRLLLVAFSMLFTGLAISQGLGFKAGLNLTSFNVDPDEFELDSKIGFQVGAFYELSVADKLMIRPGLSYSTKGVKVPEEDGSISVNYLDIPIDVVYKLDVGSHKLGIHAGPYLGILSSASDEDGDDITEQLKSTDFGINFGLGYELQHIILGINYGLGLSDITDGEGSEEISIKNTNISFTVAYRL